jgi:hypothetical protein
MIVGVHGIAMGSKYTKTVKTEFGPLQVNVEPKFPGKIFRQEKVMVSFAKADPDTLLFQGDHPIDDLPESGIDALSFAEPEIKEITSNDKLIQGKRRIGDLTAAASPPTPQPVEKTDQSFIVGTLWVFQVNVGEEDYLHAVSLSFRRSSCKEKFSFIEGVSFMAGRLSFFPLPFKQRIGYCQDHHTEVFF